MRLSSRTASPGVARLAAALRQGAPGPCRLGAGERGRGIPLRAALYFLRKAYLTVTRAAYLPEDGQLTRDEQEKTALSPLICRRERRRRSSNMPKIMTCTASGATAPFSGYRKRRRGRRTLRTGPRSAGGGLVGRVRAALYPLSHPSRDLRTGVETTIVDGSEPLSGQRTRIGAGKICRVSGRSQRLCPYDMETQKTKKLFTHEQERKFYNYLLLDGRTRSSCAERRTPVMPGRSTLRTAP